MDKGTKQGIFFCASVGERTYLRFIPTNGDWQRIDAESDIVSEIGTCLRIIECDETSVRQVPARLSESVYDSWEAAQRDIWQAWSRETDPANLQPKVRP